MAEDEFKSGKNPENWLRSVENLLDISYCTKHWPYDIKNVDGLSKSVPYTFHQPKNFMPIDILFVTQN